MDIKDIKFKAKLLDTGEWIEGDLIRSMTPIRMCTPHSVFPDIPIVHRVDPATICQFTGLKDCEGNEIWEHDLLQSQKTKAIYEVVWDEGDFTLSDYVVGVETMIFLCSALRTSRIKVIGNKFDKEK